MLRLSMLRLSIFRLVSAGRNCKPRSREAIAVAPSGAYTIALTGGSVGLCVDLFEQDAGEQEIGKDDDPAEAEPGGVPQHRFDARLSDAGEGDFSPAETHFVAQPVRELGDVGVCIRVAGAAPDDDEQGLSARDRRILCRRSDPVSRRSRQLWADRKIAS